MSFETLLYVADGPVATITLNRADRLNTIVPPMPDEFDAAVREATLDHQVKVIVVRGAGRAFCAGYDFDGGFHHWDEMLTSRGRWDPGRQAAEIQLINAAVPFEELEAVVAGQAQELASLPSSQLAAMKLIVNQAYENMGMHATQTLGPILDGLMRNTLDAHAFIEKAAAEGVGREPGARRALRRLQHGRRRPAARPGARDRALSGARVLSGGAGREPGPT